MNEAIADNHVRSFAFWPMLQNTNLFPSIASAPFVRVKQTFCFQSSLCGRVSSPDQIQAGLGPRLILLLTRFLYCQDQMLAVSGISQHRISSSKLIRTSHPFRCLIYAARWDNMVCGLFGGTTLAIWRGSETPFVHEWIKNTQRHDASDSA